MSKLAKINDELYKGHRQRLRERLFETGPEALQDYELLEMMLFQAIPRRDVKPLAKKLLAEFGDLWTLLNQKKERLFEFGLNETAVSALMIASALVLRAHKRNIIDKPVLSNWNSIVDYCKVAMAHETNEQFRLLFLDRKNKLLADEVHQSGTIDRTPVYPREVAKRAMEVGAGAIVMVHNHPSGNANPSMEDIEMTKAVVAACHALDVTVHDHLIIIKGGKVSSFKALGLL